MPRMSLTVRVRVIEPPDPGAEDASYVHAALLRASALPELVAEFRYVYSSPYPFFWLSFLVGSATAKLTSAALRELPFARWERAARARVVLEDRERTAREEEKALDRIKEMSRREMSGAERRVFDK